MSIQRSDLPNEDARELPVEKVIRRARPLPPREEMLIDDLTDEESLPSGLPSLSEQPTATRRRRGRHQRLQCSPPPSDLCAA